MVIPSNIAEPLTILGVFAHPDDEGFGSGGTLAMLVDKGHRVSLICATNGDVGEISDPALATPENLGQVRQQEMRDAMKVTGVKDVRFLGYRDSGMDGTPDNDNPNSLYRPHRWLRPSRPHYRLPTHHGGDRSPVQWRRPPSDPLLCLFPPQQFPTHVERDAGRRGEAAFRQRGRRGDGHAR